MTDAFDHYRVECKSAIFVMGAGYEAVSPGKDPLQVKKGRPLSPPMPTSLLGLALGASGAILLKGLG